jgi:hypothetical protein
MRGRPSHLTARRRTGVGSRCYLQMASSSLRKKSSDGIGCLKCRYVFGVRVIEEAGRQTPRTNRCVMCRSWQMPPSCDNAWMMSENVLARKEGGREREEVRMFCLESEEGSRNKPV